ncbi:uncharacterized protein LOC125645834 isoform X2 [Ostrea edulis]|uniref:uncharacterized protein LOC125645834 isoform X2 n=1 Tax=Ostrea edulis TaxID=37623 RepID=UPI0020951902|nr:uncharacterized protein LOC125645834 isoform X2 [Ostrea edulis]
MHPARSGFSSRQSSSLLIMAKSALRVPFVDLKQPNSSISLLKLINCDGGFGYGIPFTSSSVLVDYVDEVDADQNSWYAETALHVMEDKKLSETEWMTRIAVHYLSRLSVSHTYKLDSCYKKKFTECPCSCKKEVNYGDTSIGNPHTWYGQFGVLLGNYPSDKGKSEAHRQGEVAASEVQEADPQESSSDDLLICDDSWSGSSQAEIKLSPLNAHMPQLHSQTIVFSFYQKKCHSDLNLIPFMGVSRNHIQFHFYDSKEDIYLLSREMPLFYADKTLNMSTVIATWLVLNYQYLMSGVTAKMKSEKKFGFHSSVGPKYLKLFQNDIEMGPLKSEPYKFNDIILTGKRFLPQNDVTADIDAKYARKAY